MSSFTAPLAFEHMSYGFYKTHQHFRFYLSDSKTGEYCDVPSGFISNGASIPRHIQRLFRWHPMDTRWAQASFLHDGLVGETGTKLPVIDPESGTQRLLTWKEATIWFDHALAVKREQYPSCPPLNRWLFVSAVRVWGILR